ncbi:MAG: acetyltransferase [Devosia sp.]|nr:acetyltransferase [Devosia sp.]
MSRNEPEPGEASAAVVLWGAGGHALSLSELAHASGLTVAAYVVDEGFTASPHLQPVIVGEMGIAAWLAARPLLLPRYLVAIGMRGRARSAKADILDRLGLTPATLSDPTARIAASARIGEGTQVFFGAHVGPYAVVGRHCILNTGCCVEHEAQIGDNVDLAPHSVLLGQAKLGNNVVLGANATVLEGRTVCDDVIVGAGSVIAANIDVPGTYVGTPARRVTPPPNR